LGAPKFKIGHMTTTIPIWWTACRPKASSWYEQPVYKIWSL